MSIAREAVVAGVGGEAELQTRRNMFSSLSRSFGAVRLCLGTADTDLGQMRIFFSEPRMHTYLLPLQNEQTESLL